MDTQPKELFKFYNNSMSAKFIYIANARIPTEKAHGLQIMKMCEAFTRTGQQVELWVPNRANFLTDDPFAYYQVASTFTIHRLPVIDLVGRIPVLGHWIESISFAWATVQRLRQENSSSIIYSRDQFSLWLIGRLTQRNIFFEFHVFPKRILAFHKYLWRRCRHIFTINKTVAAKLQRAGISPDAISAAPSAVDASLLQFNLSREQARQQLALDAKAKLAVYIGHLYPEKGVDTVIAATQQIPDCHFLLVGGTDELIAHYREHPVANVTIVGRKPHEQVFSYIAAADIVLLPNSARYARSAEDTSPMKLFEYMALRRPIVASRVPAIEEILDDQSAYFFQPDDPASLAQTIQQALTEDSSAKVAAAWAKVQSYTWDARAKAIISRLH